MTEIHDTVFHQQRAAAFDSIIAALETRINELTPAITTSSGALPLLSLKQGAEKEIWSLFRAAVQHLKDGAPGGQPGSLTEALARASLRSSTLAAALQIKPPQFEQIFPVMDSTSGREQALFLCRRLIEAAEGDLQKSTQIIQQKMAIEKPSAAFGAAVNAEDVQAVKQQMAAMLNVMTGTYGILCKRFKAELPAIAPPPGPAGKTPRF